MNSEQPPDHQHRHPRRWWRWFVICLICSFAVIMELYSEGSGFSSLADYYRWDEVSAVGGKSSTIHPNNASMLLNILEEKNHQEEQQVLTIHDLNFNTTSTATSTTDTASIMTTTSRMIPRNKANREPVRVLKTDSIMQSGTRNAPIVLEEYKLIFFPIQKVGGTVWKQLFRRMLGHEDWQKGPTWGGQSRTGLVQLDKFSTKKATSLINDPTFIVGTMVRDPKQRFLSSYLDKAVQTDYFWKMCFHQKRKHSICRPDNKKYGCTFAQFINVTESCFNKHWAPQSYRMENKYFPLLDFVGHLETAAQDAKELLEQLGVWEEFGETGWGKHGNESIFQSISAVAHKTRNSTAQEDSQSRLARYYTPELEAIVEKRMQLDYDNPTFHLQRTKIEYPKEDRL